MAPLEQKHARRALSYRVTLAPKVGGEYGRCLAPPATKALTRNTPWGEPL
jgi:hypothetical protein